jgi:hypothetical protein
VEVLVSVLVADGETLGVGMLDGVCVAVSVYVLVAVRVCVAVAVKVAVPAEQLPLLTVVETHETMSRLAAPSAMSDASVIVLYPACRFTGAFTVFHVVHAPV